jgi:hypothetical protein
MTSTLLRDSALHAAVKLIDDARHPEPVRYCRPCAREPLHLIGAELVQARELDWVHRGLAAQQHVANGEQEIAVLVEIDKIDEIASSGTVALADRV